MAFTDPEDYDSDELDLLHDEDTEPDFTPQSLRTFWALGTDEFEVAQTSVGIPDHPILAGLVDRVRRLELLLGDANAMIADMCIDIRGSIEILILEIKRDPSNLVMSSLAQVPNHEQVQLIDKFSTLLHQRRQAILEGR